LTLQQAVSVFFVLTCSVPGLIGL